ISRVLLRSGVLYYCLTTGFQIASTTHVFLGLPYTEFVGMIYVGLSSALACRVFHMVLLDGDDGYKDEDDGEIGMRPVCTVRRA
ncbi:hypothetical protein FIBSPDRAFT_859536, partial [Athelia psychrophila]